MIKKFIKGLAFGAAVGGAAGLLLAPRSGRSSREKLVSGVDEATELTNNLSSSLANFQSSLTHLKATAQELLPPFQAETEKLLTDYKFQAEPRVAAIQDQIKEIQQELDALK